jgi:hypothetical protein
MIFANTSLPVSRTETFETVRDGQTAVTLPIYESDFTDEENEQIVEERFCTLATEDISELKITGNHPKGTQIQVTFSLSEEGILSVNATRENDVIDFQLRIKGVKTDEELEELTDEITESASTVKFTFGDEVEFFIAGEQDNYFADDEYVEIFRFYPTGGGACVNRPGIRIDESERYFDISYFSGQLTVHDGDGSGEVEE